MSDRFMIARFIKTLSRVELTLENIDKHIKCGHCNKS